MIDDAQVYMAYKQAEMDTAQPQHPSDSEHVTYSEGLNGWTVSPAAEGYIVSRGSESHAVKTFRDAMRYPFPQGVTDRFGALRVEL